MRTKFSKVIAGIQFDFLSINIIKPEIFQVYVNFGGRQWRFHMQRESEKVFKITDERNCPPEYRDLVPEFNAALQHHCKS